MRRAPLRPAAAPPAPRARPRLPLAAAALALALLATGCGGRRAEPGTRFDWMMAMAEPRFDPSASEHPGRWALERLLTRGLTDEDTSGAVRPAAAESWTWSADSLVLTFRLRRGLAYADGRPCRAADFRAALERGLADPRHATKAWRLRSLVGASGVRAGRPLPELGIDTPDDRTLVLRLAFPDPMLPLQLSRPGVSDPWLSPDSSWGAVVGLGPYRVSEYVPGRRLVMVPGGGTLVPVGPDTIAFRIGPGVGRTLAVLRQDLAHLVWPVPWSIPATALPPGSVERLAPTRPPRRLLLVLRADAPPTLRLATRQAIAHAIRRDDLVRGLGGAAQVVTGWIPGAPPFEFPAPDRFAVQEAMQRAKLGRSFHVVLAYDPDGAGGAVAERLQDDLAASGIYAELEPLRGRGLERQLLRGQAHLTLVDAAPPGEGIAGELAAIVTPGRGPAIGVVRTGWRTREFERWTEARRGPGGDPAALLRRLEEERVVLPLATLPWRWIERGGAAPLRVHPRYGPEPAGFVVRPAASSALSR